MLEFMVLGEIPGTQVQYNFNDVLLASAWILVLIEAAIIIQRHRRNKRAFNKTTTPKKLLAATSKSKIKQPSQKARTVAVKLTPTSATN